MLRFVSLAFICLAPSLSIAQTLKCVSPYTSVRAEFVNGAFKSTTAYSNENEDLHATTLAPSEDSKTNGAFEFSLETLDDNCELALPSFTQMNRIGFHFITHLECFDQNNVMVNDNPVQGMAGMIHGESMNCSVN